MGFMQPAGLSDLPLTASCSRPAA